ncbi:4'-phosphopantetheinyl transferase [Nocardiopsis terrae]|uniref:4'-phosphopantetheinyl transferase n=1 Tax=Nocardiopsis terrae TaxID=372655 RepID=A0ABR9HD20_9ACTN|nr:4'-phosphopantetheinyl transferase superfamily protein [Nocardiopsis terrae]MBE1456921.1 4'-phosphopantetheinyl transferase [Nocardiopsis terrae]
MTLASEWLDDRERASVKRFVFDHDRRQYSVAHAMLRRVLALETGVPESGLEFGRTARGRPFLREPEGGWPRGAGGIDFNLSHCRGTNALAVVRHRRVGVDVERCDRRDFDLDRLVGAFTTEERGWISAMPDPAERARAGLRLWTLKEAYAKARGLGLGLPFDSFAFHLAPGRGVLGFVPPDDDRDGVWGFAELTSGRRTLLALAVECAHTPVTGVRVSDGFPWRPHASLESLCPEPDAPVHLVGAPDS